MGAQDLNELPGTDKAVFDIYKHVTTLCSASIVILAAAVTQKSVPAGIPRIQLAIAIFGFAACIILGVVGMCFLVKEHSQLSTFLRKAYSIVGGPEHLDPQQILTLVVKHPDLRPEYLDVAHTYSHHSTIKRALTVCFGVSMACLVWFIVTVALL
jgi:hypothetical protein